MDVTSLGITAAIGGMMAALSSYALTYQQRYAQFEDMAIGLESAAGAAHSGVMSVLGLTPLTDLTNIVVDELGEAVDRTGEILAGARIGLLYIGRWVDKMSDVARRAKDSAPSNGCRPAGRVKRPWSDCDMSLRVSGIWRSCHVSHVPVLTMR